MKKNDRILIAVVFLIAAVFLIFHFWGKVPGRGTVEIQVDGELYGAYPLTDDCQIEINNTNQLEIEDGKVSVIWADCPDQVCVHHKSISIAGESIICLPNKVVISIVDGEDPVHDAIAD